MIIPPPVVKEHYTNGSGEVVRIVPASVQRPTGKSICAGSGWLVAPPG